MLEGAVRSCRQLNRTLHRQPQEGNLDLNHKSRESIMQPLSLPHRPPTRNHALLLVSLGTTETHVQKHDHFSRLKLAELLGLIARLGPCRFHILQFGYAHHKAESRLHKNKNLHRCLHNCCGNLSFYQVQQNSEPRSTSGLTNTSILGKEK